LRLRTSIPDRRFCHPVSSGNGVAVGGLIGGAVAVGDGVAVGVGAGDGVKVGALHASINNMPTHSTIAGHLFVITAIIPQICDLWIDRLDNSPAYGIILFVMALMETSTRKKPLQRIRGSVSRVQELARKIPPELLTEQSG